MYKLFFTDKRIVVYDKSDKEFRAKYGPSFEMVGSVKEDSSLTLVCERLKRQYNAHTVIYDCHIKNKWGWKYFTDEQKAYYRQRWSKTRAGRPLSEHQKKRISEGKTGKRGNHTGHTHSDVTKNIMSLRAMGHKRNTGSKWCYDPLTGVEKRSPVLLPGFVWGRNPELGLGWAMVQLNRMNQSNKGNS